MFGPLLRALVDAEGVVLGRASVTNAHGYYSAATPGMALGVVTVGGLRSQEMPGAAGIFVGSSIGMTRSSAVCKADAFSLAEWASQQASVIVENIRDPAVQMGCSTWVIFYGGSPGRLPIAKRATEFVSCDSLAAWKDIPDEVMVAPVFSFVAKPFPGSNSTLVTDSISFYSGFSRKPEDFIVESMAGAWGCRVDEVSIYRLNGAKRTRVKKIDSDDVGLFVLAKPRAKGSRSASKDRFSKSNGP